MSDLKKPTNPLEIVGKYNIRFKKEGKEKYLRVTSRKVKSDKLFIIKEAERFFIK